MEEMYSSERISETAAIRSEAAALRVKVEGLQSQVQSNS